VLGGMCASHGWPTLRLDGSCSVKQRQALVDTFNNPEVCCAVCFVSDCVSV
jgi:SNF2 family DNA or RNA helicase